VTDVEASIQENILVHADGTQLGDVQLDPQYDGVVETEMVTGEQCFRFVNSNGEQLSEGNVFKRY
jgi:hypothetical protein